MVSPVSAHCHQHTVLPDCSHCGTAVSVKEVGLFQVMVLWWGQELQDPGQGEERGQGGSCATTDPEGENKGGYRQGTKACARGKLKKTVLSLQSSGEPWKVVELGK